MEFYKIIFIRTPYYSTSIALTISQPSMSDEGRGEGANGSVVAAARAWTAVMC
jgi:hypothetical protein